MIKNLLLTGTKQLKPLTAASAAIPGSIPGTFYLLTTSQKHQLRRSFTDLTGGDKSQSPINQEDSDPDFKRQDKINFDEATDEQVLAEIEKVTKNEISKENHLISVSRSSRATRWSCSWRGTLRRLNVAIATSLQELWNSTVCVEFNHLRDRKLRPCWCSELAEDQEAREGV